MFTDQKAWAAIYGAISEINALPDSIKSRILSITISGSLVRGDFIEDNSDIDVYTLISNEVENFWMSDEHKVIKTAFDYYLLEYKGYSHNPFVWDDVCVNEDNLPKSYDEMANQVIKTLGIYSFDLIENHRTVYGDDFTSRLPRHPNTRSMVPKRLDNLLKRALNIFENEPENQFRIYMFAIEGIKSAQLYFGDKLSIHKSHVIKVYRERMPNFPMKQFGLEIWQNYIETQYPHNVKPHKPISEYIDFLKQIRNLVCKPLELSITKDRK